MQGSWETFFKIIGAFGGLLIAPVFGWVWTTNLTVQQVKVEQQHLKAQVDEMGDNSTDIKLIKQDIDYIKERIKELKTLLIKNQGDNP